MSQPGPTRWYYTVVTKLHRIVQDGVIQPAPVVGSVREKPAVRFSSNPFWEETANEMVRDADGVPRPGTRESTHWTGRGLARIGVRAEDSPHDWKAYKGLSGLNGNQTRQIYEAGIAAGAKPGEWFASFDPIPAAKWVKVEIWNGVQWVPFTQPTAAAPANQ